jgi:WhiB family redox-sensing transcriptional regulator
MIGEFFKEAACKESDPDLFFSDEDGKYDRKSVLAAKALCAICPIVDQCFEFAVSQDLAGIWGGKTDIERTMQVNGTSYHVSDGNPEFLLKANAAKASRVGNETSRQLEVVLDLVGKTLPPENVEIARMRIKHPDLPLAELGERMGISKDVIAGRIRRMKAMYQELTNA